MRADKHGSAAHLSDDQLVELCFAAAGPGHLAACDVCQARHDYWVRALAQFRDEADRKADAVFTSERLATQRDRILRRLERGQHSAELVMFPVRPAGRPLPQRAQGLSMRWVSAAAVAGLVAGLFLGRFVDTGMRSLSTARVTPAATRAVGWPGGAVAQVADDELLFQIEDALTSGRVLELRALDDLTTPEFREISVSSR